MTAGASSATMIRASLPSALRAARRVPAKLGLPEVTPHSARHAYVSNLQAAGIEVATVAMLAGHANPTTTLSVYTHASLGGGRAAEALESAYT